MLEDEPRDQVGCEHRLSNDQSAREPPSLLVRGLPCILVIGEAALAADLITRSILEHLERNFADQAAPKAKFRLIWPRYNCSGPINNFHLERNLASVPDFKDGCLSFPVWLLQESLGLSVDVSSK